MKSNSEYVDTPEGKLHNQQFTEHIDLRSAQISDLQHKIIDSDQGIILFFSISIYRILFILKFMN